MKLEIGDLIQCGCCPMRGIIVSFTEDDGIEVSRPGRNDHDWFPVSGALIIEKHNKRKVSRIINEPAEREGD